MLPQDALKFPLVGSAVLFGLFITFKVLPKNLVNLVLAGYFALLGVLALTATVLPFIEQLCSARVQKLSWTAPKFHLPSWLSKVSPLDLHCLNPTTSISMLAADSPGLYAWQSSNAINVTCVASGAHCTIEGFQPSAP